MKKEMNTISRLSLLTLFLLMLSMEGICQDKIPAIVQKYYNWSGVKDNPKAKIVEIHQEGKIKAKPDGDWMKLKGKGTFAVDSPGYHWKAKASTFTIIDHLSPDGSYKTGKALGIFRIFDVRNQEEADQSSYLRYLSELPWLPQGFFSEYISWEEESENSARITLLKTPMPVWGIFYFDNSGKIERFEGERYRHTDGKFSIEKWSVEYDDYDTFNGVKIPTEAEIGWYGKDTEFEYFHLTDINYYNVK